MSHNPNTAAITNNFDGNNPKIATGHVNGATYGERKGDATMAKFSFRFLMAKDSNTNAMGIEYGNNEVFQGAFGRWKKFNGQKP